ncbi:MAG TPA: hypothetical protein PKM67_08445 [Kiritimatiellia bacterium]|nr:hypothetical protein [Kiritimatiellia bacterium]HNS81470.1 hypothetical protein [Kiritimatiellia bacterium]
MENRPVSVGDWMLTYLLMCIPLVNIIMLLVWAFGGGAPESKSNWAKASLIWMVIGIVLTVMLIMAAGGLAAALSASGGSAY